jgi:hypothetical protein
MEMNERDIEKLKQLPGVKVNVKYLKDKNLWIIEKTETIFINGVLLDGIKEGKWDKNNKSSPQKPVTQAPQKKTGQFDDFE